MMFRRADHEDAERRLYFDFFFQYIFVVKAKYMVYTNGFAGIIEHRPPTRLDLVAVAFV